MQFSSRELRLMARNFSKFHVTRRKKCRHFLTAVNGITLKPYGISKLRITLTKSRSARIAVLFAATHSACSSDVQRRYKFPFFQCNLYYSGRWHRRRNVGWGCLKIGCWGEYLGLRGTRWQGSRENYIMRSLMICTADQILFGWSNQDELDGRGM